MYEAVHPHPNGESTAARFVREAPRYGYDGVVVRERNRPPADDWADAAVDVVDAVEVVADDPTDASGVVGNRRSDCTLLLVRGGTDALNRFAVEQVRVDVLSRPLSGAGDFNHVLARAAARNGVRVEFDFGPVLRSNGGPRVQALQRLRKLRELVADADAPFVVSANPASHLQLRGPRELVALGEAIGFEADAVRAGLREWGRLAERNRERRSETFIEPGVQRGTHEEEP